MIDNESLKFERELEPTNGRKSFYHKAKVYTDKNGNKIVCYKDKCGMIHRIYDGWTSTTGNHINSFCGLNKKEFTRLAYEYYAELN